LTGGRIISSRLPMDYSSSKCLSDADLQLQIHFTLSITQMSGSPKMQTSNWQLISSHPYQVSDVQT
ncbi:MAG: hypothetical protein V3R33_00235, partial [Anaerolineales bacterium]